MLKKNKLFLEITLSFFYYLFSGKIPHSFSKKQKRTFSIFNVFLHYFSNSQQKKNDLQKVHILFIYSTRFLHIYALYLNHSQYRLSKQIFHIISYGLLHCEFFLPLNLQCNSLLLIYGDFFISCLLYFFI